MWLWEADLPFLTSFLSCELTSGIVALTGEKCIDKGLDQ